MKKELLKFLKNEKSTSNIKWRYLMLCGMFIIALAIRCVNFDNPLTQEMHAFRQTQTAITVQCYIKDGWSLFKYETPVFGAPWNVIFECPVYQSIVYAFMRLIGTLNVDMGCRAISIIMFMLSAVMLYRLALLLTNKTGLSMTIYSLYLFLPYNIYWSRAALIDYTSVLFGLIYVYYLFDWLYNRKRLSYAISMIGGICAYLQKSTSMFPVIAFTGLLILKYYYDSYKQNGCNVKSYISGLLTMRVTSLIVLCVFPAVVGYLWVVYSDAAKDSLYYTRCFTSDALKDWNHGTLSQKLNLDCWKAILNRLRSFSYGSIILIAVFIMHLYPRRKSYDFALQLKMCISEHLVLLFASLTALLFTIVSLFNLYYVHNYYIIALTPFLCVFVGIIVHDIASAVDKHFRSTLVIATALTVLITCLSGNDNHEYLSYVFSKRNEPQDVWNYIADSTSPDEKIIIEGHDWTSALSYKMNRKCFMLIDTEDDSYFAQNIYPCDNYTVVLAEHPERLENTFKECSLTVGRLGFTSYLADLYRDNVASDVVEDAESVMREDNLYTLDAKSTDWIIFHRISGEHEQYNIKVTLADGEICDCNIFFRDGSDVTIYSLVKLGDIKAISCEKEITGISVYRFDK